MNVSEEIVSENSQMFQKKLFQKELFQKNSSEKFECFRRMPVSQYRWFECVEDVSTSVK
jgi:hypothetical protein